MHKYHECELLNSDNWSALDQLMCQLSFHITISSWAVYLKCCRFFLVSPRGLHWSLSTLAFAVFKVAFTGCDMKLSLRAKIKSIFICILIKKVAIQLLTDWIFNPLCSHEHWAEIQHDIKYYLGEAAWLWTWGSLHKSWADWVKSVRTVIEKVLTLPW